MYAPDGSDTEANNALETASAGLSFLEIYFNVSYPLPSLSFIPLPETSEDVISNWGLVFTG